MHAKQQANNAEKDGRGEEFTSSVTNLWRVEFRRSPAWTATEKIIAVALVNHTANNTHDSSKQSMQTNTGEGENLPLQKRAEMELRFSNQKICVEFERIY